LSPHPADKRLLKKQAEKGNSCGSLFLNRIRIRKTRKAFVGYCLLLQPKKNNPIVVYYSQATPLLFLFSSFPFPLCQQLYSSEIRI
jgi:hypothetical protein